MVPQYSQLISSYAEQDAVVLLSFIFALLVCLGWLLVSSFKFRWLNGLYLGEMLTVWIGLLLYFGLIHPTF